MTTDPRDPLQAAWSNQSDSGGEVDKAVAINVFDDGAFRFRDEYWCDMERASGHGGLAFLHERKAARAGDFGFEMDGH